MIRIRTTECGVHVFKEDGSHTWKISNSQAQDHCINRRTKDPHIGLSGKNEYSAANQKRLGKRGCDNEGMPSMSEACLSISTPLKLLLALISRW